MLNRCKRSDRAKLPITALAVELCLDGLYFLGELGETIEECELTQSNRRDSRCPLCDTVLDGIRVVRYGQPFRCVTCKTELEVPKSYSRTMGLLSMAATMFFCFAIGLRGFALLVGYLLLVLPLMLLIGGISIRLYPPKLRMYRDENTLFPHGM